MAGREPGRGTLQSPTYKQDKGEEEAPWISFSLNPRDRRHRHERRLSTVADVASVPADIEGGELNELGAVLLELFLAAKTADGEEFQSLMSAYDESVLHEN